MHTVELLEEAIGLAQRAGHRVRQEWMGGAGGGGCQINGRKWIFLDLSLAPLDQLDLVLDVLRAESGALGLPMPHQLRDLLQRRKSA
jgi:hypothetical protein